MTNSVSRRVRVTLDLELRYNRSYIPHATAVTVIHGDERFELGEAMGTIDEVERRLKTSQPRRWPWWGFFGS